jgi:hypothetical protein
MSADGPPEDAIWYSLHKHRPDIVRGDYIKYGDAYAVFNDFEWHDDKGHWLRWNRQAEPGPGRLRMDFGSPAGKAVRGSIVGASELVGPCEPPS